MGETEQLAEEPEYDTCDYCGYEVHEHGRSVHRECVNEYRYNEEK